MLYSQSVVQLSESSPHTAPSIAPVDVEGYLIHSNQPKLTFSTPVPVHHIAPATLNDLLFRRDDVNTIYGADIQQTSYPTIQEFLKGRIAGLRVIRTGAHSHRIQIRGINSIHMNTEPLVVIDGLPTSSTDILSTIPPRTVSSITILKGPEAAIYGMRGANGVILINTH